ncbi:MAG: epoxyqueuosine reductase QueH [Bacilli bacterium]
MKNNYHKIMLEQIDKLDKKRKYKLLLHSCCGPCSSYVILFLSKYFDIEILFFNPNIHPKDEFTKRLEEQIRLVEKMGFSYNVIDHGHQSESFYEVVKGYEKLGEGSKRCDKCFKLRLEKTALYALKNNFDYFTTSLTISPLKNAETLNNIGESLAKEYNLKFLNSDFKKDNGYKKSVELSKEYNMYRQDYCGCVFSQKEYIVRMSNKNEKVK